VPVTDVVVASWNVHSGVDGWGRPFDVVGVCRVLDADVLVLVETWHPARGPSLGAQVAQCLGYRIEERTIASATMLPPPQSDLPESEAGRWGPSLWHRVPHGPRIDKAPSKSRLSFSHRSSLRRQGLDGRERGAVGLAVLTRLRFVRNAAWELTHRFGDPTRRAAIAVEVVADGPPAGSSTSLLVVGTHLSHLRHGSPLQVLDLRRRLAAYGADRLPTLVAGDLNLPGPVVAACFPGLRRVVRGRTWPSWRPTVQPDHVLVSRSLQGEGEVVRCPGSDHLPVRAVLSSP
jgi:endonuclease/exonuclease/phosphatase family metal-dependent hydrolase